MKADLPQEFFSKVHQTMPILCVDVVVISGDSVLLICRDREPEKGTWWFPGGRLLRNEKLKHGASRVVKSETSLDVFGTSFLDLAETQFDADPFGHGDGTHTVNAVFSAKVRETAVFSVMLDNNHSDHRWVKIDDIFKGDFHSYVKRYVALAVGGISD